MVVQLETLARSVAQQLGLDLETLAWSEVHARHCARTGDAEPDNPQFRFDIESWAFDRRYGRRAETVTEENCLTGGNGEVWLVYARLADRDGSNDLLYIESADRQVVCESSTEGARMINLRDDRTANQLNSIFHPELPIFRAVYRIYLNDVERSLDSYANDTLAQQIGAFLT